MVKSHSLQLNDVRLHYAEAPGTETIPELPLVILHGLTGSHAEFLHLVPELARQAHVYLIDLRGHGLSGHAESGYLIVDYARDVEAFLQQIIGQPAVLVAHSLGGMAAIWLAAHRPHLLRGLFLVDPPLYILKMPRFGQTPFYPFMTGLRDYLKQYYANGASLEEMVAYVGQSPMEDAQMLLDVAGLEAVRERALQLHQLDPAVLEPALAGTLLDHVEQSRGYSGSTLGLARKAGDKPEELLAQIRCPVHLLAAQPARGSAMDTQDVQRAVAQMPHCTHAVMENAGHDIHIDQPEAFVRALKQFLLKV